ncbi:Ig-like domain-containing protein [Clostridium paridis]|uniref:Ig-like domain-containing protein n=1 Tax=Clostridium paridis TaxID=2803863 RepID=A0A937K2Z5_9CLOT|nr:Ig-like domain-containing protein [Clostridium paridis]
MKKVITILCTFLMLFTFRTITYAEENTIQIATDSKEYQKGDTVKVIVKTSNAEDLYSVDLSMNYSIEYLQLISAKFDVFNEMGSNVGNGTDRYLLSILGKDKGVNGEVKIGEFEFKALKTGTTEVTLPSTIFVNSKEEKVEGIKANSLSLNITEKPQVVNVESITLNTNKYRLKVGEEYKLIQTILPKNASNKNVSWTSSNDSIVEVKDGYIKGIKEGKALITVTAEDGNKTAVCSVEVYKENTNNNGNGGNNNGGNGSNDQPGEQEPSKNTDIGKLPQTGKYNYFPIIGLGMIVLGVIIKKHN